MAVAAPIIAAAIMAGATVYQVSESNQAQKDANRVAEEQKAAQDEAMNEMESRTKAESDKEASIALRNQQQKMRRMKMAGGDRLRPTILTGALGVPGNPPTAQKTLLGA